MTKNEAAVIMAYTGQVMLAGEDFGIFHRYVERILNRPVFSHEFGYEDVWDEIKEKAKADFIDICKNATEFAKFVEDIRKVYGLDEEEETKDDE